MLTKKEVKQLVKPKLPEPPRYEGKGTKARLNTAAEKHVFNTKHS